MQPAATPSPAEIDLDLGPLSEAETKTKTLLSHCWFWNGTRLKTVHAVKVKSGWGDGEEWTIAMTGRGDGGNGIPPGDNRITGCSGRPKGKTTGTPADQGFRMENFIATVGKVRYDDAFRPDEGAMFHQHKDKLSSSSWIRVPASVRRARQRIVSDDQASPWYSSAAKNSLVYLQAWTASASSGDPLKLRLETQFLNSSGLTFLVTALAVPWAGTTAAVSAPETEHCLPRLARGRSTGSR